MSSRMTSITLTSLGTGGGLADWGRIDPEKMIALYREYALDMRRKSDAILSALDTDFRIETYIGVHVQKNKEVIQEGRE